MTEKLKTLMDRAADVEFAAVDLAAVMADGDRAVRRRRAGLVAGAAALVVAAGGIALSAGGGDPRSQVAGPPQPSVHSVTWTWRGRLHTPDHSYDLGHPVKAYVRTAAGYAFADPDGVVYAFVDGATRRIGRTAKGSIRLVADDEGSLVGWLEIRDRRLTFATYDLATGASKSFEAELPRVPALSYDPETPVFSAIDGRSAYVRDGRGAVAVDVDTDEVRIVDPHARSGHDIVGVENGRIAFGSEDGTLAIGTSRADAVPVRGVWSNPAVFSPDGRYVSVDADEPTVVDTRTGQRVAIDVDGRAFGVGYEWLDDHTLVLAASRTEQGPLELLTCEVPGGACAQVVGDLGRFADIEGKLAVANGIPLE